MNYCFALLLLILSASPLWATEPDTVFRQPLSVKYTLPEDLRSAELRKVAVSYDDIVYVLTDRGLYRGVGDQLVRDVSYRPLAERVPVDIAIQEEQGYLYYLYDHQFLTNAHAGQPAADLPEGSFQQLAVNRRGEVLVTGDDRSALYRAGSWINISNPGPPEDLYCHDGRFFALTSQGIFVLTDDAWSELHPSSRATGLAFDTNSIWVGTPQGYYRISPTDGELLDSLNTQVPVPEISDLLRTERGLWAATPQGAFLQTPDRRFRYFASQRWLDQDEVTDLASDSEGNIYLLTPSGLNRIEYRPLTLSGKAEYFEKKIRQRHMRYGFIAENRLTQPGDITSAEMIDTDNDGLWSAFYLGSQVYRYAVTKEARARRNAWECFEAYERLLSINSLDGFPSRTFERAGYKVADADRWRVAPDSTWEWKGHTSSDEFVAYIYVASLMDEFIAESAAEKQRVAAFMEDIMSHIIDNDYYFVDIDGEPTLWGRWNPEYINWYPPTIGDRRLGSLTLIAGLQLTYDLTGDERFREEAYRMINEHGYLDNILIDLDTISATPGYVHLGHEMGTGGWNHSDDEMAFLTYPVIYRHAFTEELREQYRQAIRNHWEIERPEENAVWNLISKATEGSFDEEATINFLREYPLDLIRYDIRNSHRKDLTYLEPNFREQSTRELLPMDERPIMRYNGNPFRLDGGSGGERELTGAEYLLPYWMARYLEVING